MIKIETLVMETRRSWMLSGSREPNIVILHPSDYNDLVRYLHQTGSINIGNDGVYFFNGMELISSFGEKLGVPRVGIVA